MTGHPSLEAVTDLVLVAAEERGEPPIERTEGPRPVRASLAGELAAMREVGDEAGERACCLELAARLIDEDIDLDDAVRLFHRGLELADNGSLRQELAGHLVHMGRYAEAAATLEVAANCADAEAAPAALLPVATLYTRAGDSRAAEAALRRAAALAPGSAQARERLAMLADWAPQTLSAEQAADLWLEAAQRHQPGSPPSLNRLALACDLAPQHGAATAAYAESLLAMGRPEAADEIWRAYAAHAAERGRSVDEIHTRRVDLWCALRRYPSALGAALDASFAADATPPSRTSALARLLKRPEVNNYLGSNPAVRRRLRAELADAARTKSRMGRATALTKSARRLPPDGRAVLLAVAAESFAAAGNVRRARDAAMEAWALAPTDGRVLSTLIAVSSDEELDSRALELAVDRLPARALVFRLLADRSEAEGQISAAIAWTRRWLEHAAGSLSAARAMLARVVRSGSMEFLARAVDDVLNLPLPVALLGPDLAATFEAAHALDAPGALELARDALDTLGPGDPALAELLTRLAEESNDTALLRAIVVRHATSERVTTADRAGLLLKACQLDLQQERCGAASTHLWRAASLAADVGQLLSLSEALAEATDAIEGPEHSECLVGRAHAQAWIAEQQDARTAAAQWRKLAALRWDLAGDRLGAEEAFFMASVQEPDRGPQRYAADLVDRAGTDDALALMQRRAARLESPDHRRLRARLLAAAARVATECGQTDLALRLATDAVTRDPSRSDAVAIVERVASGEEGITALHTVYDALATAALGRFGVRAAHYRAARQLEHRKAYHDALRHAISAFEAVPSSGAAYALLLRLATQCGEEETAVRSMASVAAAVPSESRVGWLQRAAEVARQAANAPTLRYDLALNAFNVEPCGETVVLLCTATEDLLREQPNDPIVTARFEHAVKVALPRLEGPSGAYTALGVAQLAARLLGDGAVACGSLRRALEADPGGGGFRPLLPYVDVLASSDGAALELLEAIDVRRQDVHLVLDESLHELFDALAKRVGYEARPAPERPVSVSWADLDEDEPPPVPAAPETPGSSKALDADSGSGADESADDSPDGSLPEAALAVPLDDPDADSPRTLPVGDLALVRLAERSPAQRDEDVPTDSSEDPIGASAELTAEETARQQGDHAELARLLAARARRTSSLEMRRLVRLRLAALLEQRLGRLDEAAEQLAAILDEHGDDSTTLRYLADIEGRRGRMDVAAGLWLRASRRARDVLERHHDLARFADALRAHPVVSQARELLRSAEPLPDTAAIEALRSELGGVDDAARRPTDDEPSTTTVRERAAQQLEQQRIDYLRAGPGNPSHAAVAIERLRELEPLLDDADRDLHAFLFAEALDATDEEDESMALLDAHAQKHGVTPLVAVAMAERLARRGEDTLAVELYAAALSAPAEFQQLRSPGVVAVEAAEAARRLGDGPMSARMLEFSTGDEVTASVGRELLTRWFDADSDPPAGAEPSEPAPARAEPSEPAPADAEPREPAPTDAKSSEPAPEDDESPPSSEMVVREEPLYTAGGSLDVLRATSRPELSGPRIEDLYDELLGGSYEAGEYLVALFEAQLVDGRAREVAVVRRHQAIIRRGDPLALSRLAEATRGAGHETHARAVEHVLHAFGPEAKRLTPPPLDSLQAHPTMTAGLLFGPLAVGVNEALAIVCDAGLLRRDLGHYGLTKKHRLTTASDSPLGQLLGQLGGALELPGLRLFHRLRSGPVRTMTGLLTPLAIIVDGAVTEDTVALRYQLGEAVAAALPGAALVAGLTDRELDDVLVALAAAFGAASASTEATPDQLRLAEDLWHVVTPAAERRLRDICADRTELLPQRARMRVRQACRRAGLFACGDLGFAVEQVVAELGLEAPGGLASPADLVELCTKGAVADLVDLAISEDFAQARWASRTP